MESLDQHEAETQGNHEEQQAPDFEVNETSEKQQTTVEIVTHD